MRIKCNSSKPLPAKLYIIERLMTVEYVLDVQIAMQTGSEDFL